MDYILLILISFILLAVILLSLYFTGFLTPEAVATGKDIDIPTGNANAEALKTIGTLVEMSQTTTQPPTTTPVPITTPVPEPPVTTTPVPITTAPPLTPCYQGDVTINWGHTAGDAGWACDNWISNCGNRGGCNATGSGVVTDNKSTWSCNLKSNCST